MDYEARVQSVLFCAICQEERLHIGHGCTDGHDADCPERLCVECGFAVIVSDVLVDEVRLVQASVA